MTIKENTMQVKFYKGSHKYGVYVPEGAYSAIAAEIVTQLSKAGMNSTGIHDVTVHHNDGTVEEMTTVTAANGELNSVCKVLFHRD